MSESPVLLMLWAGDEDMEGLSLRTEMTVLNS
jgi:hypothetical protein